MEDLHSPSPSAQNPSCRPAATLYHPGESILNKMKAFAPSSFLLALSTYHCLSSALPFGLNRRNPSPAALDYPVVNIVDPEANVPGFSDGGDDGDGDKEVTVTRTITKDPEPPVTVTRTQIHSSPKATSKTDTAVPVVGVKETNGQTQATVTVYQNNLAPSSSKKSSSTSPTSTTASSSTNSSSFSTTSITTSHLLTSSTSATLVHQTVTSDPGFVVTVLPWTPPESDSDWNRPLNSSSRSSTQLLSSGSTVEDDLPTHTTVVDSQPDPTVLFPESPSSNILVSTWNPIPEQTAAPTTILKAEIPLSTGPAESPSAQLSSEIPAWNGTVFYRFRQAN